MPLKTYSERREYDRQYKKAHRDEFLKYYKDYYQKNKEKFSEQNKKKVYCEVCEREYSKASFTAHRKTPKHKKNLKNHNTPS
jgi:hypothetical protein